VNVRYILTVDQSTSATKAIIFDNRGRLIYRYNEPHKQYYPKPGWVEHDPEEIYENTLKAVRGVIKESGISAEEIIALSITNQRETALVWDRKTGRPIYNAVVWQCKRSTDICEMLEREGLGKIIKEKSGLNLSPYFSASKIKWIIDNVESAREKAKNGDLLCGTIDSWLVWKLTDGRSHFTDYTNASRTQLLNLKDLQWDKELLEIFDIPESMLPELKTSRVYLVPAFVGLGAPYWDSEARAIITGMSSNTKKAHIVRAAEESIGYQIRDIIELMTEESGIPLKELRVDGGPTRDNFLMQFQADILNVPVVRIRIEELSALGSAFIAGLATGIWNNLEELILLREIDRVFLPKMGQEEREKLYEGWKRAVKLALSRD
jgi:glycerol kinase